LWYYTAAMNRAAAFLKAACHGQRLESRGTIRRADPRAISDTRG